MLATSSKLTGDLDGALAAFESKVRERVLRAGAGAMSNVIYNEVKANTARHVVTGKMYEAVYQFHVEAKSGADVQTYHVGINKSKAPHWHFLEFGTSRQQAYPVIRPAYDLIDQAIRAGKARMAEALQQ